MEAKEEYNNSSNLWILSRNTTDINSLSPKMLKQNRPHIFIEKPAMASKIPNLENKEVLCLGCGSGEEVELIALKGAKNITGIDNSEKLIEHAKKTYPFAKFGTMSADKLKFAESSFDFVFSSLVLHYFYDWTKVLSEVFRVMKPGGTFLFSTLHPVKWSAKKINDSDGKAIAALMGFQLDKDTTKQEILGDYQNTVKLTETWMQSLTVTMYPRSISSMFRSLRSAGFVIQDIYEPKAIEETKNFDIEYYEINQKIPNFIIFECSKP